MQLQVALDRIPLDRAVALTRRVAPHADWVEVGTSLIKRYGMASVEAVVAAAGATPVLADTKTADVARPEREMCFEAGARAATVLGMTTDATIDTCVAVAAEYGRELLVDLLAVPESRRTALLSRLADRRGIVWAPHVGKDAQGGTTHVGKALGPWAAGHRLAVAGGLTARDVEALAAKWPGLRVIVGSAITGADHPAAAVTRLRAAMTLSTPTGEGCR